MRRLFSIESKFFEKIEDTTMPDDASNVLASSAGVANQLKCLIQCLQKSACRATAFDEAAGNCTLYLAYPPPNGLQLVALKGHCVYFKI
jgi:hypothetical protein